MSKCLALATTLVTATLVLATGSLASDSSVKTAVTYTGTLGGQAIIVELTELKDGPLLGRYSYQSRGVDIPLHGLSASMHDAVVAEEKPCTPALCVRPDGDHVLNPPLGAQFQLQYSADNTKLTGTWRASDSASAALPVYLTRFGERPYDRDDDLYYGAFLWTNYDDAPIAPETTPYDYAKMQVALTEGPLETIEGASYHDVTDPRTKFAFPRIDALPGGGDIAPINTTLDHQRWATSFSGFNCLSMDYRSGGWMELPFGTGGDSLGGIDQESVSIDYLSDTVMAIRQTGHSACGGGAPYDYIDYHTYDVRAGGALDLSQIFKDWDANNSAPTRKLIDWVIAAYRNSPGYDADRALWCVTNDHLNEGLDFSFAPGDVAVFLLHNIEDTSCMGPVLSVPLAEIKELLTDKAADYFPSLKS